MWCCYSIFQCVTTMTLDPALARTPSIHFHFRTGFPPNRVRFFQTGFHLNRHPRWRVAHFPRRRTSSATVSAVLEFNEDSTLKDLNAPPVRIVALVGQGSVSPLKSAPWLEVMLHTVSIAVTLSLSLHTHACIFWWSMWILIFGFGCGFRFEETWCWLMKLNALWRYE